MTPSQIMKIVRNIYPPFNFYTLISWLSIINTKTQNLKPAEILQDRYFTNWQEYKQYSWSIFCGFSCTPFFIELLDFIPENTMFYTQSLNTPLPL